jgi:signal transduction histidine kinase
MQKTLFKKYLRITMSVVLVSFILLGTMLFAIISRYWQQEKHAVLYDNATALSQIVARKTYPFLSNSFSISLPDNDYLNLVAGNISGDIFIVQANGSVLLRVNGSGDTNYTAKDFPSYAVDAAMHGQYAGTTTLDGIYSQRYYVVGVPIVTQVNGNPVAVGVLFTSTNARYLTDFRDDMFRMFLFAAIAALAVTFCAVGFFSYSMVRPLREMAIAARCFGAGDFTRRVPVTSQDEIGQLALAFNNMASSLSSSEGVRRSFIANVSHELKTPMTTIAGFIDGILDGTIPPDRQRYYLKIVSDEVKRLSRLVKTMLDLSRIDNGELHMNKQQFNMTETVLKTMLNFESSLEKKQVEVRGLEDAPQVMVNGDPDMLHQVVYNLVENAAKFVNERGYIEIFIGEETGRCTVRIKNSGQGIPAEEVGMIFDKFYKTDKSRSQDKNGMGLGLYIVKTIIKQHGGDIQVHSTEGEFCEFSFWIPTETTAELAKPKKSLNSPEH